MMVCASPGYLQRRGTPRTPEDLAVHECLAFSPTAGTSWHLKGADGERRVTVSGQLQINHGQALRVAALNGLGIVMQPAVLLEADVAAGRLVALFPGHELGSRPMQVVYLPDQRSLKLRSFVGFVIQRFGA
jgi:DNA-binding transcriptional LysR family regulator